VILLQALRNRFNYLFRSTKGLALVVVATALIIGKWVDFKGALHKISVPLMIFGIIVITFGVWTRNNAGLDYYSISIGFRCARTP
jgi:hypothetical protein